MVHGISDLGVSGKNLNADGGFGKNPPRAFYFDVGDGEFKRAYESLADLSRTMQDNSRFDMMMFLKFLNPEHFERCYSGPSNEEKERFQYISSLSGEMWEMLQEHFQPILNGLEQTVEPTNRIGFTTSFKDVEYKVSMLVSHSAMFLNGYTKGEKLSAVLSTEFDFKNIEDGTPTGNMNLPIKIPGNGGHDYSLHNVLLSAFYSGKSIKEVVDTGYKHPAVHVYQGNIDLAVMPLQEDATPFLKAYHESTHLLINNVLGNHTFESGFNQRKSFTRALQIYQLMTDQHTGSVFPCDNGEIANEAMKYLESIGKPFSGFKKVGSVLYTGENLELNREVLDKEV
ncbi:hypothetical protein HN695_05755 [Candidatus Woesearchaeota archaeon]|jgi:hypothetical protein|nr:hypothetical protein [Candidatus Woesearchaeota archaeon]MBT5272614.1 hypothetical protein [Candidatus Woesearchaeota archaeon]MBT6041749.1 hypothetical protein [Candidatus Woesearchaeota archaeon]MBT6337166.1 hypothetical protein [Candidatus Woesearchaeota archaeon]MBT7927814.1 hypothetical protein [Candidatus Woesearchaeota archaeon]